MADIVAIARKDIGKKEKPGNTGFEDKELETRMKAVGWQAGWAWCAAIQEVWAWEALPELKESIKGLFVPSAVNTFRNLVKAGYSHSMIPTVGAFVYWQRMQDGKALWQGHAGVVSKVISDTEFFSIEGNTNSAGSREGDSVQEKHRFVKHDVENGLKVIGFVVLKTL
jgi:hypothetical protein